MDAVELGSIPAAGSLDVVDALDRVKRSELDALLLNLWQLSLHHQHLGQLRAGLHGVTR